MKYIIVLLCLLAAIHSNAQTDEKGMPYQPKQHQLADVIGPNTPQPTVYSYVEQMPKPSVDINQFIAQNTHYPEAARKKHIEGKVIVGFVVMASGKIDSVHTIRSIGYGCDEEAERVIKLMPPWQPGKQGGKPVNVKFFQPIDFKLTD